VLKHTVFGDWNPFDEYEVFTFMNQKSGQIVR
jgi:pfkB family carbohydrate kinase